MRSRRLTTSREAAERPVRGRQVTDLPATPTHRVDRVRDAVTRWPTWRRGRSSNGSSRWATGWSAGQVVARVETEKSDIDIEIWHVGVVDEIVVPTKQHRAGRDAAAAASARSISITIAPATCPGPDHGPVVAFVADIRRNRIRCRSRRRRWRGDSRANARVSLRDVAGSGPARRGPRSRSRRHRGVRARASPTVAPAESAARAFIGACRADALGHRSAHGRIRIVRFLTIASNGPSTSTRCSSASPRINEARPVADRVVPAAAFVQAVAHAAGRSPRTPTAHGAGGRVLHQGAGVNVSVAISLRTRWARHPDDPRRRSALAPRDDGTDP